MTKTARGFSLIEILLVLVIMAIVTLMSVGQYQRYTQQRDLLTAQQAVQSAFAAAYVYYQTHCSENYKVLAGLSDLDSSRTVSCPVNPDCNQTLKIVNPFYKGVYTYGFTVTYFKGFPPLFVIYLPVSSALTSNQARFNKFVGLLRPTAIESSSNQDTVCKYFKNAAACLLWQGSAGNFATVSTSTLPNAQIDMNLRNFTNEEAPSSAIQDKINKDHADVLSSCSAWENSPPNVEL